MLSSQVKFSADRRKDSQTRVKQYDPDLSMREHKTPSNQSVEIQNYESTKSTLSHNQIDPQGRVVI